MYTKGSERFIHIIRGSSRFERIVYPPNLPEGAARRGASEPAHKWILRCDQVLGNLNQLAVEENLALLIIIKINNKKQLDYANLQALWTEVPLENFALGDGKEPHRYLRADYDESALGPLLKEPLPHVHVEVDGEPRFPIPLTAGADLVGWFLDFVYRNFFYHKWNNWAEQQWESWCRTHKRENRWKRLVQAFEQSNIGVIEKDPKLREDLLQLKQCLYEKRKEFFPVKIDEERLRLFGHDPR